MTLTLRIDHGFASCKADHRTAVIPYITGGYPNLGVTASLIRRFDALGAAVVEVGFPFSDSIADGAVIQDSFHRVLQGEAAGRSRFRIGDLFDAVADLRGSVGVPLVAMVSYSIVYRTGLDEFARRASAAGFDGWITPDVPLDEVTPVAAAARSAGLANIMLVAATTPIERVRQIVSACSGFVYQIAAAGTTGERSTIDVDLADRIAEVRTCTELPICAGFGISKPEHVRKIGRFADGAIIGSAIVRRITEGIDSGSTDDQLVNAVSRFVERLVAAGMADY